MKLTSGFSVHHNRLNKKTLCYLLQSMTSLRILLHNKRLNLCTDIHKQRLKNSSFENNKKLSHYLYSRNLIKRKNLSSKQLS